MKQHQIFYNTKIVRFSAITTEWPYPRKRCWKRLSDFNKIKFYQHLYHCKRKRLNKNMLKTFNWLVFGNKCEIYLFTKEIKKKKQMKYYRFDTWKSFISYKYFHIEKNFSNRKKREIWHDAWNLFVLVFKKVLFVVKLS